MVIAMLKSIGVFKMISIFRKKIVLKKERNQSGSSFLDAEIKGNGDLVFEGQDLGRSGEGLAFFEYEYAWTVKADDLNAFKNAIGGKGNILKLLKKNFSNEKAGGIQEFMTNNNIPFESWARFED